MGRVFVIGPHKCGTSSLHRFFNKSGLRSIHYDHGSLPLRMYDNAKLGRPILEGYEAYNALSDTHLTCAHRIITPAEFLTPLLKQEPGMKFILNTRNLDRWTRSRFRHHLDVGGELDPNVELGHGVDRMCASMARCSTSLSLRESYRRYYGFTSFDQVEQHMRTWWHAHMNRVRNVVPLDRLLVFNIEQDDPRILCEFLELPASYAKHYRRDNPTLSPSLSKIVNKVPYRYGLRDNTRSALGRVFR